ncbi:MAG: 2-amino-4-hydroxy-6-hydroxymethyldihydropteridine diphosphokinase [Candidatus Omnitrophica bacterium]|nr:2-amino-4-hydroxy-6-hydroxymethyldihydropteridine diphosphokinase [Candidatus Omnitrophota bacterium]
MSRVFIGVGSNDGDRLAMISRALRALAALDGVRLIQMAMVRETAPVGGPPQGLYLNTAAEIDTSLPPSLLLKALKAIERTVGRAPARERWAPRVIDLDVLLYDDRIVQEPGLQIPHPRLHERRFVLEPLAELTPELTHPVLRQSIAELLKRVLQQEAVPQGPLGEAEIPMTR